MAFLIYFLCISNKFFKQFSRERTSKVVSRTGFCAHTNYALHKQAILEQQRNGEDW